MELVATSKLRRATDRMKAARPYSEALNDVVRSLYAPELADEYPLLRRPDRVRRAAVLLLTANRGFCGAFNANLIREAQATVDRIRNEGAEVELHVSGKKGIAYFRFRGEELASSSTSISDMPSPWDAEELIAPLREAFEAGDLDSVHLVGSEFRSAMSTPPRTRKVLPIQPPSGGSALGAFILSPDAGRIVGEMLPAYLRTTVYRALVENAAGEQGARRAAMKSATDNAGEILENLTRTYNRARQAQVTQEIAEIVGGAAALG